MVFKLPGSGKSFFASRLAGILRAEYLNSDSLRKMLLDTRTYSMDEKMAVYRKMPEHMKQGACKQVNLVLDATFNRNEIRRLFFSAKNADEIIFIELSVEEVLIRERLKKPRQDSDADFEVYEKIKKEWEPLNENHLILQSTDDNINEMLLEAADYLHVQNDKTTN